MCSKNYLFIYISGQVKGFDLNEAIVLDAGAAYIIPGYACTSFLQLVEFSLLH